MKKIVSLLGIVLFVVSIASVASAKTYECYRYVDGHPTGGSIKVEAETKSDAYVLAMEKYKKLGYEIDSVNCH